MEEIIASEIEEHQNGHIEWKTFNDDQALLQYILTKKPAEELIEIPEWGIKILCKAMNAETRIKIQIAAYDEKTKRTDYRNVFAMIVMAGCFNPATNHKIFTESHKDVLMKQQDGAVVEKLSLAILRLSGMLSSDSERTRKN